MDSDNNFQRFYPLHYVDGELEWYTYYCAEELDLSYTDSVGNVQSEKLTIGLRSLTQATSLSADETAFNSIYKDNMRIDIHSDTRERIYRYELAINDGDHLPGTLSCRADGNKADCFTLLVSRTTSQFVVSF